MLEPKEGYTRIRFTWIGEDPLHPREIDAYAKLKKDGRIESYIFPKGTDIDDLFFWMEMATDPRTTFTRLQ